MREARVGDRYLVCSDGLSGFVARETIQEILVQDQPPGVAADRLVGLALRAGAPDNVTCIIGDIVDLDKSEAPSTAQEVVGAAAERKTSTSRVAPATPAAKAAALSREASGAEAGDAGQAESEDVPESATSSGRWRWVKVLALVLLGLIAVAGGGYAAYTWSQQQYYVGEANGRVAVYEGVSQTVGPWQLSHVVAQSDIRLNNLPDFYRGKLDATVSTSSIEAARRLVTDLRVQAIQCQTTKTAGGACGASGL